MLKRILIMSACFCAVVLLSWFILSNLLQFDKNAYYVIYNTNNILAAMVVNLSLVLVSIYFIKGNYKKWIVVEVIAFLVALVVSFLIYPNDLHNVISNSILFVFAPISWVFEVIYIILFLSGLPNLIGLNVLLIVNVVIYLAIVFPLYSYIFSSLSKFILGQSQKSQN